MLVVEAGKESGALITAKYAMEQNKVVYAVPNSIYSNESIGTNGLISKGARIYSRPEQLLPDLCSTSCSSFNRIKYPTMSNGVTDLEKKIVEILRNRPLSIDGILNLFKEEREQIIEQIAIMEIGGKVKSISGGKIAIL